MPKEGTWHPLHVSIDVKKRDSVNTSSSASKFLKLRTAVKAVLHSPFARQVAGMVFSNDSCNLFHTAHRRGLARVN